jgi:hypothetical protein
MRLARRPFLLGAAAALVAAPARASDFDYRDWSFDTSALKGPVSEGLAASLRRQIDIVESTRLKPAIKAFLRDVDVKVDPSTLGQPAFYRAQRSAPRSVRRSKSLHRIYLSIEPVPPDAPLLLAMLMFAWLDQRMEDGWRNKRVAGFYEEALRTGAFARDASMMKDAPAFFASGAATVLHGRSPREPFERARVQMRAPGFYDWIAAEFCVDGVP